MNNAKVVKKCGLCKFLVFYFLKIEKIFVMTC
nr:MAG TPA: hypothetical protein [Caudoviricetes sp.]